MKKEVSEKLEFDFNNFIENLDNLKDYVISVNQSYLYNLDCPEVSIEQASEINKNIKDMTKRINNEDKKKLTKDEFNDIMLPVLEDISKFTLSASKRKSYHIKENILYRSALMSLVIFFETLISDIFISHLKEYPDSLLANKTIMYKDLRNFDNIEDAKEHLIETEIEGLMRNDFESWCEYFEKKLDIDLNDLSKDKKSIIEVIQRRNLFVHNDGRVNNTYLKKVENSIIGDIKKGDVLKVDIDYISNSIELFKRAGIIITYMFYKNNDKKSEFYYDFFSDYAYTELQNNNNYNSEVIFKNLIKDNNRDFADKTVSMVNYLISIKNIGRIQEFEKEIVRIDESALSDRFKVPILILKDKIDLAFSILNKCKGNEIKMSEIREWPVFAYVKDDPRYLEIIGSKKHNKQITYITKKICKTPEEYKKIIKRKIEP